MYLTLKGLSRKGSNSSVYEAFIQQSRDQNEQIYEFVFQRTECGRGVVKCSLLAFQELS